MRLLGGVVLCLAVAAAAVQAPLPGDAKEGAALFESQRCVKCHSINGKGGTAGPDLGKRAGRGYSPALMAGLMWNHAPAMWSAMEKQGIAKPDLDEQQAANLFAYFFSTRYFDRPGDAARGRRLFVDRRCADCHNLNSAGESGAPPVVAWTSLADPITLAQQMWSHTPQMRTAMEKRKIKWPSLASQEMTDILVYLQNLPQVKKMPPAFAPASAETGRTLFEAKGCANCHKGTHALEHRFGQRTPTDFAAAMWNHAPQMVQPPPSLSVEEMRRIVGYLWSVQFFDERGNAGRGQKVFAGKGCQGCHGGGGAPALAKRGWQLTSFAMVSNLWKHGPAMQAQMKQKNVAWPRFQSSEMPDLVAYLNSLQ